MLSFSDNNSFCSLLFLLILLSVIATATGHADNTIIVRTGNGEIRGGVLNTLLIKRPFHSFKGIPYAKPPIGDLRYKAPVRIRPWTNVLNTTEYGNVCVQKARYSGDIVGDENCLFLNVFTPNVTQAQLLPVIFYIHGGGYIVGGADLANPDILLEEDIVLVTTQYRLGPFGFVAFNRPEYSGNMGLKDQLLALKWVNDNIRHFGGDKSNLTIYGHSAGASSVNFHMLSQRSRGLFRRAIASSGSAYNQFAYLANLNAQTEFLRNTVSTVLGANKSDIDENKIIAWLKTANARDIVRDTLVPLYRYGEKSKGRSPIWAPVIEKRNAIQPFLIKVPDAYFNESSDVDSIFGYTSGESIFYTGPEFSNPGLLKPFNESFDIQPPLAGYRANTSSEDYKNYTQEVRHYYFGDKDVNSLTLNEYTQLLTDVFYRYGIDKAVRKQAIRSSGRTYYFEFDVQLDFNFFRYTSFANEMGVRGSAHVEDLPFLFKTAMIPEEHYRNLQTDSPEIKIINLLRTLIVKFVKFGDPTSVPVEPLELEMHRWGRRWPMRDTERRQFENWDWGSGGVPVLLGDDADTVPQPRLPNMNGIRPITVEPVTANVTHFLAIRNEGLRIGIGPHANAFRFWTQLLSKYSNIFIK